MHTCTTAYPTRRVVTGEQWSEKLGSKRMVRSTPPSPVEKVSTSEIIDTEEEVQFKRPSKRIPKQKTQAKDDSQRYSMSDIQLISYLLMSQNWSRFNIKKGINQIQAHGMCPCR